MTMFKAKFLSPLKNSKIPLWIFFSLYGTIYRFDSQKKEQMWSANKLSPKELSIIQDDDDYLMTTSETLVVKLTFGDLGDMDFFFSLVISGLSTTLTIRSGRTHSSYLQERILMKLT